MDFLEGFLLSPIWGDTYYKTRSHKFFNAVLSSLITLLFLFMSLVPKYKKNIEWDWHISLVLGIVLFVITPVLAYLYYKINIFFKILILFTMILKFFFFFHMFFQLGFKHIHLNFSELALDALNHFNDLIFKTTNLFGSTGKLMSNFFGMLVGGILAALIVLGIIVVCLALPGLILFVLKGLQRLLDTVCENYIFKKKRQGKNLKKDLGHHDKAEQNLNNSINDDTAPIR